MTAKQSPQEKEAKKAAKAAAKAARQSSTSPPAPEPTPDPTTEEQSSTPPEAAQEPIQIQETNVEASEPPPAPEPEDKPKRGRPRKPKPCRDPLKVAVGSVVRYWLPLAGARARLIEATVAKVTAGKDRTVPPVLELEYPNVAGKTQVREAVEYAGHRPTKKKNQTGAWLQGRTGKWLEFSVLLQADPPPE